MNKVLVLGATGNLGAYSAIALKNSGFEDVGMDIFARGWCLPSDNKMTPEQQNVVIEIVRRCFG